MAAGIIRAAEHARAGARYILAGPFMTVAEIFDALARVTGQPAPTLRIPYPVALSYAAVVQTWAKLTGGDALASVVGVRMLQAKLRVTSARAESDLGWRARPFNETLRDEVAWVPIADLDARQWLTGWRRFSAAGCGPRFVPRPGAAQSVPYDREAIARSPSITWIGHSTFLVRMDGVTFLTDPMFSNRASPFSFAGPRRAVPPGVPLDALPPVDFVLLSHDHCDHTDLPTVTRLAERRGSLRRADRSRRVGPQCRRRRRQSRVVEGHGRRWRPAPLCPGEALIRQRVAVGSEPSPLGGMGRLWCDAPLLLCGRHGLLEGLSGVGSRLGPIDLAAVPIGASVPLASIMMFVHTTPEEGLRLGLDVGARRIVAMHFRARSISPTSLSTSRRGGSSRRRSASELAPIARGC